MAILQQSFICPCAELNSSYKNTGAKADLYTSDGTKGAMHFFDAAGEATWVIIDPSTGVQVCLNFAVHPSLALWADVQSSRKCSMPLTASWQHVVCRLRLLSVLWQRMTQMAKTRVTTPVTQSCHD